MNGVLIVDKPGGMTSHDVVAHVRRQLGIKKVGHLGTLDPMATGVLPLSIGKATRLARFIPASPKEYTGRIRFGWATTTCDREGEALASPQPVDLDREDIVNAMDGMTGRLEQIPPAYSAKKVSGVTAYRLARRGIALDLPPVSVEVEAFDLVALDLPCVEFRIRCSGGTYVRSLARDLGEQIGTGAHLDSLRRTRSGPFGLDRAVALDQVSAADVIPPEELLTDLGRFQVDGAGEDDVRHGRPVECTEVGSTVRIFNKKLELIAVATMENGWAHPKVVLL